MIVYNELAGVEFTADILDEFHQPTLPTTVHYVLTCDETDKTLIAATQVAVQEDTLADGLPRYYVSIEIPGSAHAMQRPRTLKEQKTLLVISNMNLPDEFSEAYPYYIRRVSGRS
jgi:hypothetical protein